MIDLGTGNNNKINWAFNNKQELIDIIEVIYRGGRKGRGLVVSPKDCASLCVRCSRPTHCDAQTAPSTATKRAISPVHTYSYRTGVIKHTQYDQTRPLGAQRSSVPGTITSVNRTPGATRSRSTAPVHGRARDRTRRAP